VDAEDEVVQICREPRHQGDPRARIQAGSRLGAGRWSRRSSTSPPGPGSGPPGRRSWPTESSPAAAFGAGRHDRGGQPARRSGTAVTRAATAAPSPPAPPAAAGPATGRAAARSRCPDLQPHRGFPRGNWPRLPVRC